MPEARNDGRKNVIHTVHRIHRAGDDRNVLAG